MLHFFVAVAVVGLPDASFAYKFRTCREGGGYAKERARVLSDDLKDAVLVMAVVVVEAGSHY